MLALVIGVIITAIVVSVAVDQQNDAHTQEAAYAVQAIRTQADAAYANSLGYMTTDGAPVTMQALFGYDQRFPRGVYNTATPGTAPTDDQITNTWGGTYAVTANNTVASAPGACGQAARPPQDLLAITLTQVPSKACNQLIGTLAPQMYDTYINTTLVGLDPAPSAAGPGRRGVRYTQAAPLCDHATNTLVFRWLKPLDFNTLRSYPQTTVMTAAEQACLQPQYTRVQDANTAREAAQLAL